MTGAGGPGAADACPACEGLWPAPADRIAELSETILYLHTDQYFPGWSVLVLRRHATELFDLAPEERARLIEDVSAAAWALKQAFDARKVNYALFGNLVPHIHWHLIPRLPDDPAPRDAVFAVPHEPVAPGPGDRAARIGRIRSRLRR